MSSRFLLLRDGFRLGAPSTLPNPEAEASSGGDGCRLAGKRKNVEPGRVARHDVEAGRVGPERGKQMRKVIAGLFHSIDGVVEAPTSSSSTVSTRAWAKCSPPSRTRRYGAHGPGRLVGMGRLLAHGHPGRRLCRLHQWRAQACRLQYAGRGRSRGLVQFHAHRGRSRRLRARAQGAGGRHHRRHGRDFAGAATALCRAHGRVEPHHPSVVAGEGRHLFEPGDPTTRLELVRCSQTPKGNLVQVYRKRAN